MKKHILGIVVTLLVAMLSYPALADNVTIRPDGQGVYADWANYGCGSGSSEWQCVAENPANTSDYLFTKIKERRETFTFSNTGLGNVNILSMTLYYYAKEHSSIRYKTKPLIRIGNTNYEGNIFSFGSSWAYFSQTYTTNPSTGSAWIVAELDALEAGMQSNSNNPGGQIAQVYAVIDYHYSDSCNDTDGGNYTFTYGYTFGYLNRSNYTNPDYCVGSTTIMEYYCNGVYSESQQQSCGTPWYGEDYCYLGDVYANYTNYSCSSGECDFTVIPVLQEECLYECYLGECKPPPNNCSDTDGGDYPLIFGTVSGIYDGSPYSYDDYCLDDDLLWEYYCYGPNWAGHYVSCGNYSNVSMNCTSGRCIEN